MPDPKTITALDLFSRSGYGPDKCRGCGGDSWPHSPLPQAVWS